VLREYDADLAARALNAATAIFREASDSDKPLVGPRVFALTELFLATQDDQYLQSLQSMQNAIVESIGDTGWIIGRVMPQIEDQQFVEAISEAVKSHQAQVNAQADETPYGVPYKPHIWGAGWGIQRFGVAQYFFHRAWPEHTDFNVVLDALNFILGVHPGENTMSFASGVGANSALVAYGVNRADWSFIPGGVISGTALIRPDLPELKIWPFFWQQTEYVMGGGATNFMFLVLAADAVR
jgi:hypothetical protein